MRIPKRFPIMTLGRVLMLVSVAIPLGGCQTLTSFLEHKPLAVDTTCQAFGAGADALLPFKYHSTDNPDTKTRARAVNRIFAALCPP